MPIAIGPMPADVYRLNSCSRCARADNCYDTDVEIPYEGALALCRGCIGDLAACAGYDIAGTRLAEAVQRAETAERAAADAKAQLDNVMAALRSKASTAAPKPRTSGK